MMLSSSRCSASRAETALRLWRERVGLLDALVDVHATGAKFVRY